MSALGEVLCSVRRRGGEAVVCELGSLAEVTKQEFPAYKRSLISQGRSFCAITAPQCREKIAALAVDFLRDECTVGI